MGYYFITDSIISGIPAVKQVEKIIEARIGVRFIQYREKNKIVHSMLRELREIKSILPKETKLIVNDRMDLALGCADGVHLGEIDLPIEEAIKIKERMGLDDFIIGASATSIDSITRLNEYPVDYVGFGPIFSTSTKTDASAPLGTEGLKEAIKVSKHPIVAIGGINKENLVSVLALNVDGIAAISLVLKENGMDLSEAKRIQKHYGLI